MRTNQAPRACQLEVAIQTHMPLAPLCRLVTQICTQPSLHLKVDSNGMAHTGLQSYWQILKYTKEQNSCILRENYSICNGPLQVP